MFSRLFRKPKTVRTLQQSLDDIEFAGPVQGSGLATLRMELAPRVRQWPVIDNAYLPKLKYAHEATPRNCLVLVEHEPTRPAQKQEIAATCSGLVPMDIFYSLDLPRSLMDSVRSSCMPLFVPSLSWFECPLLVKKGTNEGMPIEWPLGVSFWYVAAHSYEDALFAAVTAARATGFTFVNVYGGKVLQLDPTKWWSDMVMGKWREYSEHLPTQQQVEVAIATGGLFMGPTIGPAAASDA